MKTSNKLLLTALLLVIGFLATYNLALLAEYRTGRYKDPYQQYTALNLQNFNAVTVNAASKISVKIMAGPYQVRVFNDLAEVIKIKQTNSTVFVDLDLPEEARLYGPTYQVVISCPTLHTLRTDAVYTANGKKIINKNIPEPYLNRHTLVQGFRQANFQLQQDHAGAVNLADNRFDKLTATVGASIGSTNTLTITKGNLLQNAHLDLRHQSKLVLNDVLIPNLNYQLSDSTRVTCSGAALGMLKNR